MREARTPPFWTRDCPEVSRARANIYHICLKLLIISQFYFHIRQPLMVLMLKHNYSYYPSAEGARKFLNLNFYNIRVLYAQAILLRKIVKENIDSNDITKLIFE